VLTLDLVTGKSHAQVVTAGASALVAAAGWGIGIEAPRPPATREPTHGLTRNVDTGWLWLVPSRHPLPGHEGTFAALAARVTGVRGRAFSLSMDGPARTQRSGLGGEH
jgi:hypothetical protein